jgi:glycosyltransferase involved in cell wall biosynthesis
MRIAYVVTRADEIGGAQAHVRDLASAMHGAGHEVTVLAGMEGALFDQLAERKVPFQLVPDLVRPIAFRRDVAAVRQLKALIRALRPDVITTHSSKAGWLGRLAARQLRIPVIFTAHGWAFTEGVPRAQRSVYAMAERLMSPLADQIITVSSYDRELALEHRIAPADKITCIHNGVRDLLEPGAALRTPAPGPVRIAMLGRFVAQKDHASLLKALATLRPEEWLLDLAGDGPGQAGIEALAAELGVAHRVRFLGHSDDIAGLLRRSDVLALISHWEGLPYSILEAMSLGLPVIASDVGGVSEAVVDGESGRLVPRGDVAGLQAALAELISHPELRRRLGTAGRRRYEAAFRFERMFSDTLALYERVAAPQRTDPSSSARSDRGRSALPGTGKSAASAGYRSPDC